MKLIAYGEALHPKTAEQLMVPKLPVVGGPADCNLVIDYRNPAGERWQVIADDGQDDCGYPMVRVHVYRVTELDGIRSLLYVGPGMRVPSPMFLQGVA